MLVLTHAYLVLKVILKLVCSNVNSWSGLYLPLILWLLRLWDATDKRKTPIDESTEHKMIELFYERSKPEDTLVVQTYNLQLIHSNSTRKSQWYMPLGQKFSWETAYCLYPWTVEIFPWIGFKMINVFISMVINHDFVD